MLLMAIQGVAILLKVVHKNKRQRHLISCNRMQGNTEQGNVGIININARKNKETEGIELPILTSGVNMCLTPDPAPSNVTPRMKNMIRTTYGNNAVKYTA